MMGSVRFHFLSLLSALLILGSNAALSEGLPWKTIAPPKKDFQLVVNSSELKVRGPVNTEEIGKNQAGAGNIQYLFKVDYQRNRRGDNMSRLSLHFAGAGSPGGRSIQSACRLGGSQGI